MPMPAAIKAELLTDPAGLGYTRALGAKNPGGLEFLLNAPNDQWSVTGQPTTRAAIKVYLITAGKLGGIIVDATNQSAAVARLLLTDPDFASVDVTSPAFTAVAEALLADGLVSKDDLTAIVALGSRSPASRAEVLWGAGVNVSAREIGAALDS